MQTNREHLEEHLAHRGEDIEPRYAAWAEQRRTCPVAKSEARPRADGNSQVLDEDVYVVYRHDDVQRVMGDDTAFTKPGPEWRKTRTLLAMNGEEHRVHRALIADSFAARAMPALEASYLTPLMHRLVDRFAAHGSADLVRDFTSHYPFEVVRTLIGIEPDEHDEFIGYAYPADGLNPAWEDRAREFLLPRIHAARVSPKDDLLGLMATSELDGAPLTDEDFLEYLLLLIPAGADTTVAGSSNMFAGLLLNPDQLDLVRKDRSLVNRAVNEALRWQNPAATTFLRRATCPVEIAGVELKTNTFVRAHLSSHNRDEATYTEPDRFDLTRDRMPAGVFGYGPHICLGMHLARAEMRVALNVALDRLPNLRLDPDAPTPYIRAPFGPHSRGDGSIAMAPSLPVLFDAEATTTTGTEAR
jgi:cytochrome P450